MNYVIFDMEWDTKYFTKQKKFVNEIVEIGAVKLNDDFKEIDRFSVLVRSSLSEKVSNRFVKLTNITNSEMLSGMPLKSAINYFKSWIDDPDNTIMLTWSNTDLYVLVENYTLFAAPDKTPDFITKYVDAQKLVQDYLKKKGNVINSQISLQHAAEMLDLKIQNIELHRAVDDSELTSKLFILCYEPSVFKKFIININKTRYFERLTYKPHYISDIKDNSINRKELRFKCENCRIRAKQITDWKFNNRSFKAHFKCRKCNTEFIGCVSFKRKFDSVSVKRRRIYPSRNTEIDALKITNA